MANLNKVFMIGNLTRDPELRYLPNGTAVTTFTVASNRAYTLQTGEKKQDVTFMRIVVWARRAEVCGEYLSKGSSVFVEGRLQSRSWEGQDGQKRNTVEVVAENVQFLSRGKKSDSAPPADQGEAQEPLDVAHEDHFTARSANSKGPVTEEDEIPF
ncbi:MAG: single-stranded DNA-binding protein [Candidatus Omnitrophota bacterium]